MLPFEDRYSRQRRLVEVGPEGQRRLEQTELVLAPHADTDVEREYLTRAGITRIGQAPEGTAPVFPWSHHFRFSAPLAVARGAWCALSQIRVALGREPG
ncbi:MAG TPA: hypothetical protein VJU61_00705 [Polyangiaceae bacterium]|nr:hypothetical protein [Polyangiaceae bacterium]